MRPWQRNRFLGVQYPWDETFRAYGSTGVEVETLYQAFKERLIAELRAKSPYIKDDKRVLLPLVEAEIEVET